MDPVMRSLRASCTAALLLITLLGACARKTEAPAAASAPAAEAAPEPSLPAAPQEFLEAFMKARLGGDDTRARLFLGLNAASQFEQRAGGLTLTPPAGESFSSWRLVSFGKIDASSYEARVRIDLSRGAAEELLFLGPGPAADKTMKPLTIRGAELIPAKNQQGDPP